MKKIIECMAIDFGNGHVKMTYDGKVTVEPCVYAIPQKQAFSLTKYNDVFSVRDIEYISGKEAIDSKLPLKRINAVESEIKRYEEEMFEQLMLFNIIKQIRGRDIEIKKLVLGTPNAHYERISEILKKKFTKKVFKNIIHNNKECNLSIEKVVVVPQPIGTYFNALFTGDVLKEENILIVDIGFGTVDISNINNGNIIDNFGNDLGLKHVYKNFKETIKIKFPGVNFTVHEMDDIVRKGFFQYAGEEHKIESLGIDTVLQMQFNDIIDQIREKYDYLEVFDKIIFTGGGSLLFNDIISSQDIKNFIIYKDAQVLNTKGFYHFGNK